MGRIMFKLVIPTGFLVGKQGHIMKAFSKSRDAMTVFFFHFQIDIYAARTVAGMSTYILVVQSTRGELKNSCDSGGADDYCGGP
jgi:hypothetical protein